MTADDAAMAEARYAVRVTNAAIAIADAQNYDAAMCSCAVAVMATIVAADDPIARTMLAREMVRLARELDADAVDACMQ